MKQLGADSNDSPMAVVGWREWVTLPDLGLGPIKGKIDTGAQTSALHATDIVRFDDGEPTVRFRVYPDHHQPDHYREVSALVRDIRPIKNSGGRRSFRVVIRTHIVIGGLTIPAEVTLVERAAMRYPMLIGRTALRTGRFLVDSHRSYLQGRR